MNEFYLSLIYVFLIIALAFGVSAFPGFLGSNKCLELTNFDERFKDASGIKDRLIAFLASLDFLLVLIVIVFLMMYFRDRITEILGNGSYEYIIAFFS